MKNDDKVMGLILVFVFCVVVVIIVNQEREVAEIRHAADASHGEVPKPEGHGR